MSKLNLLHIEWLNRGSMDFYRTDGTIASMSHYEEMLLKHKDKTAYCDNWMDLILQNPCVLPRHRNNPQWIVALLYLLDDRKIPISHLQTSVNLHQGRMYKTLGRAGVMFKATTSALTPKIPEDFRPWAGEVYFDPLNDRIYKRGREIRHRFEMADIGRDFLEGEGDDRYVKDEKRVFIVPTRVLEDEFDLEPAPFPIYKEMYGGRKQKPPEIEIFRRLFPEEFKEKERQVKGKCKTPTPVRSAPNKPKK